MHIILLFAACITLGPLKADAERCLLGPNPYEGKSGEASLCIEKKFKCYATNPQLPGCGVVV